MHRTTRRFWERFDQLPESTQRIARRNHQLLKENPAHRSLDFKKVGRYWSVRVGRYYRALATEERDGYTWFWIGGHAEYDRIIR